MPALQEQLIHMFITLFLLIGVIFVLAFLYKKFGRRLTGNTDHLKVIATLPLGSREKLLLVQVGDEQLLLGTTTQHISTLHRLDQPLDIEAKT